MRSITCILSDFAQYEAYHHMRTCIYVSRHLLTGVLDTVYLMYTMYTV